MAKIKNIISREILDSRGIPTLETRITLADGTNAVASVPSGVSTGKYEAIELRDKDDRRYLGMGVLKAINNVEKKIAPFLIGMDVDEQEKIDRLMIEADGTENKANFGANSILSVSLSLARVASLHHHLPLYQYLQKLSGTKPCKRQVTPLFNVINGGLHGCGKFNFQEFFFIPAKALAFADSLKIGAELYQQLKTELKKKKLIYSVGDEGGFTPDLSTNYQVLKLLQQVISDSPYSSAHEVYLGLDLAASTFYRHGEYYLSDDQKYHSTSEYIKFLVNLQKEFQLLSLEDPLNEDDWGNWQKLNKVLKSEAILVGDDLLVTNIERLKKAIHLEACSAVLIKLNQIGTLTETLEVIRKSREANFKTVISHRSGETNDDFIADLAVAVDADFVKFGAPARGERVAKYNRLLQIYQELNS